MSGQFGQLVGPGVPDPRWYDDWKTWVHDLGQLLQTAFPAQLSSEQILANLGRLPINVTAPPFNAKGDGVTNDTRAFQMAFAIGGTIIVPIGTYILDPELEVTIDDTALVCLADVKLKFPVVGANTNAILVTANNFSITGRPLIEGPSNGAYVAGENGIKVLGVSDSVRFSGVYLDIELYYFGYAGVLCQWVDNIGCSDRSYIHHCGYIGFGGWEANNGVLPSGMRITDITPGTGSNMYCVQLSTAPDAAAPPAFVRNWVIGLQVENCAWAGIDTHGCHNTQVIGARTYNCRYGIALTGSSGAFADYAGTGNAVIGNVVDARKSDGSAGDYENLDSGIILNGSGTPVEPHRGVIATGNFIYGYGNRTNGTAALAGQYCEDATISDNTIASWEGVAINIGGTSGRIGGAIIKGAASDQAGAPYSVCVWADYVTASRQNLVGIQHAPEDTGYAALEGFRTRSTIRPFLSVNDFTAATTPVVLPSGGFFAGTDVTPILSVDLGGGGVATTVDLSEFAWGTPEIELRVTASAPITITNLTGAPVGTRVTLVVISGSSAITYDRSAAALNGGANFVSGAVANHVYTMMLLCVATSGGVQWIEVGARTDCS